MMMNDDHDDDEADLVSAEGGEKARGGAAVAFEPTALKDSDQTSNSKIFYQGCSDKGFCYPIQTINLK